MTEPIPSAMDLLDSISGHVQRTRTSSADRPVRLAKVDPTYDPWVGWPDVPTPPCRVTFEGESTLSTKAYPPAQGFIPRPDQRVWMVPQGNGYLVAGGVNAQSPQGFWQAPDGTESGVELGGGSYFDTTEGMVLEGDLTVNGTVSAVVAKGLVLGATFTSAQVTSAATEKIMDYLIFNPEAGRQYELRWMTVGQGTVAGDAFAVRFRLQETSGALTTAGTQFMRMDVNGAALAVPHQYVWPVPAMTPGTTYALGATVQRLSGTGTWSANSAGTGRRLELHDVGAA